MFKYQKKYFSNKNKSPEQKMIEIFLAKWKKKHFRFDVSSKICLSPQFHVICNKKILFVRFLFFVYGNCLQTPSVIQWVHTCKVDWCFGLWGVKRMVCVWKGTGKTGWHIDDFPVMPIYKAKAFSFFFLFSNREF